MTNWIQALARAGSDERAAVVVTVASNKGSVPREAGARMVVTANAVEGTIGGGHLEFQAIAIARDLLASGGDAADLRRFPLGAALGQCCGGVTNLLFDPVPAGAPWVAAIAGLDAQGNDFAVVTPVHGAVGGRRLVVGHADSSGTLGDERADRWALSQARALLAQRAAPRLLAREPERESGGEPELAPTETGGPLFFDPVLASDFRIVLFGAGHVGRAMVRILGQLPCRVTWIDDREHEFPSDIPANVECIATDTPEAEVALAPQDAYFLVMTHSHGLDQSLAEAILRREDFAFFGLIGSTPKRRQFERRLAERGIAPARIAAMTCPIGVPGIKGKEPAVIAVSAVAQLLQVREQQAAAGTEGATQPADGTRRSM